MPEMTPTDKPDANEAAERAFTTVDLAIEIVNSHGPFQPFTVDGLLRDVVNAKTAGRVIQQAYAEQAAELAELREDRDMLMTALDGLLNDFIKAVPSSEPIDCAKFTRYQPALLAYVTVRDRKPLDGLGVRA